MKRGSITIYLCLTLTVLLSLILAGLASARTAAARAVLSSGMEQSLFSLFSRYDSTLFETYGLLFLDGGWGGTELSLGSLLDELEAGAAAVITPEQSLRSGGRDFLGISLSGSSIGGYTLATDENGAVFRRQVCETMLAKLGASGIQLLQNTLEEELGISASQEDAAGSLDEESLRQEYEEKQKEARAAGADASAQEPEQQVQAVEVPADFVNPIDVVENGKKMGLLSAAIPDLSQLSNAALEDGALLSDRVWQSGMGLVNTDTVTGEQFLLLEYLVEEFSCFTDGGDGDGLRYQVEYAIGGKRSDTENLKRVLTGLLGIREASNLLFLRTDPVKSAEAEAMALLIASALLIPEAVDLVALLLELCWAYGESILDLRELLDGGKIPLIKDASSWQLSLDSLADLWTLGAETQKSSENGLDYSWYLRLLLCMKSTGELTGSLMDLVEYRMRLEGGNPEFRLDNCIESAEFTCEAEIGGMPLTITRSYGYDMTET